MVLEFTSSKGGEYHFFPAVGTMCNFQVKAHNDAHVALTTTAEDKRPIFELWLGGDANKRSFIRKDKHDVVNIETDKVLSEHQFRSFWVKWTNGVIEVGRKGDDNPIMSYYEPNLFHVSFLGVGTGWGSVGHWIIEDPPKAPFLWRKANDRDIPSDACNGGMDNETGGSMLIARAEHEGALIPGKFVTSFHRAFIPWGGSEHPKDEFEILCGGDAKWEPCYGDNIPNNAFEGGVSEDGETLYIGRVIDGNKLMIGKVQLSHKVCYVPHGGSELSYPSYEILVY